MLQLCLIAGTKENELLNRDASKEQSGTVFRREASLSRTFQRIRCRANKIFVYEHFLIFTKIRALTPPNTVKSTQMKA